MLRNIWLFEGKTVLMQYNFVRFNKHFYIKTLTHKYKNHSQQPCVSSLLRKTNLFWNQRYFRRSFQFLQNINQENVNVLVKPKLLYYFNLSNLEEQAVTRGSVIELLWKAVSRIIKIQLTQSIVYNLMTEYIMFSENGCLPCKFTCLRSFLRMIVMQFCHYRCKQLWKWWRSPWKKLKLPSRNSLLQKHQLFVYILQQCLPF